jgi:hypothetical protein
MNEHEKQHLESFGTAFQEFSNAVDEIMKNPSAEKGYALHRLHQVVVVQYMEFVRCAAAGEAEEQESKNNPEEPGKKELVN